MGRTRRLTGMILTSLLLLTGCTRGLLYTHTVKPLDTNFQTTTRAPGDNKGTVKRVNVPMISPPIDFAWDTNAIGEIAKRNGIESVEYADLETVSLLLGLWRRYTVHVYGFPSAEKGDSTLPVK